MLVRTQQTIVRKTTDHIGCAIGKRWYAMVGVLQYRKTIVTDDT